jgi:hypothetical protein
VDHIPLFPNVGIGPELREDGSRYNLPPKAGEGVGRLKETR